MPKGIPGSKADHGTSTRYFSGCRCEPCRTAGSTYLREWRQRKYGTLTWDEYQSTRKRAEHGTETRYVAGCRCNLCRAAGTEARKRRRQANQERENQYHRDYKWLTHYG